MTLQELSQQIYADNLTKGYDTQSKALSRLLILSEISEALEAIRKDEISYVIDYKRCSQKPYDKIILHTLIDELADIVIRTLDYVSRFNVRTEALNQDFRDVCNDVIRGTEEVISIESISFDLLCDYILRCIADVRDDADWCVNIMCIPPILAKYYKIPIRDLEYIIFEKIEYNKSSFKKSF